jgi:hypothetical protein
MKAPKQGASASAGEGNQNHDHSQQMAFAAQRRLNIARQLGGGGNKPVAAPAAAPSPVGGGDFRQHAARASGVPQVSPQEIHGAIDALTQAGHFTPLQGAALKHHQGALQGPQGIQAVAKIGQAIRARRAAARPQQGAGPSVGPVANGGMPAGMGQ